MIIQAVFASPFKCLSIRGAIEKPQRRKKESLPMIRPLRFSAAGSIERASSFSSSSSSLILEPVQEGPLLQLALDDLDSQHRRGVRAHDSVYASLIRRCSHARSLPHARRAHALVSHCGRDRCNTFLGNLLVQMYGKCGDLEQAQYAFHRIHNPDSVTWNSLIAAYTHNGRDREALHLFQQLQNRGSPHPDTFTFVAALSAASNLSDLPQGKHIHDLIIKAGCESNPIVENALISMYAKCGCLMNARAVFDGMTMKDAVSWNAMIGAYARTGQSSEALQLFALMGSAGVKPNRITYLAVLGACSGQEFADNGRAIHQKINTGTDIDISISNALISMYGKCGSVEEARSVFDGLHGCGQNEVSWNAMIGAYAQNGLGEEALELFWRMNLVGMKPDKITFINVLDACTKMASLENGRLVHEHALATRLDSDISVSTALVNMYGKCGSLKDAQAVFDKMECKNLISWNTMISAYTRVGLFKQALELFQQMALQGVKPDYITFLGILDMSCSPADMVVEDVKHIHESARTHGFESDIAVNNALVNIYGKYGSPADARAVFDKLDHRDAISWTTMIAAYANNGHSIQALELFEQMELEGFKPTNITYLSILGAFSSKESLETGKAIHKHIASSEFGSDISVQTSLLNMYAKCGSIEDARAVFDDMHQRDVISWNAMIAAYAQNGHAGDALNLFRRMGLEGVKPDRATFLSTFSACADMASLDYGKEIYECFVSSGLKLDVAVKTAVLNMFGKCGSLKDAQAVFGEMQHRNVISWNAMIATYAHNGFSQEALQLFRKMDSEGVKPNKITSLHVLHACSHAGLLNAGWDIFIAMTEQFEVTPSLEHYVCMVDLLGRARSLGDAEDLIKNMPVRLEPSALISLLGACRVQDEDMRNTSFQQRLKELVDD